jgi:hypothetical protein
MRLLDFLKQIDGVHLVRCRFWNIADEDFIKDSAFNNLKLRASLEVQEIKIS